MATGKVLQFDHGRGYGFVAADDGGEDIFLHASVFDGDSNDLVPGAPLEFQVMAGDRGRKAYAARFTQDQAVPQQREPQAEMPAQVFAEADDDQMCDILTHAEFGAELTELLLRTIPALTGAQILEVRNSMVEFAKKNGWVDA